MKVSCEATCEIIAEMLMHTLKLAAIGTTVIVASGDQGM